MCARTSPCATCFALCLQNEDGYVEYYELRKWILTKVGVVCECVGVVCGLVGLVCGWVDLVCGWVGGCTCTHIDTCTHVCVCR